jgi:hypothetical protein
MQCFRLTYSFYLPHFWREKTRRMGGLLPNACKHGQVHWSRTPAQLTATGEATTNPGPAASLNVDGRQSGPCSCSGCRTIMDHCSLSSYGSWRAIFGAVVNSPWKAWQLPMPSGTMRLIACPIKGADSGVKVGLGPRLLALHSKVCQRPISLCFFFNCDRSLQLASQPFSGDSSIVAHRLALHYKPAQQGSHGSRYRCLRLEVAPVCCCVGDGFDPPKHPPTPAIPRLHHDLDTYQCSKHHVLHPSEVDQQFEHTSPDRALDRKLATSTLDKHSGLDLEDKHHIYIVRRSQRQHWRSQLFSFCALTRSRLEWNEPLRPGAT